MDSRLTQENIFCLTFVHQSEQPMKILQISGHNFRLEFQSSFLVSMVRIETNILRSKTGAELVSSCGRSPNIF